MKNRSSVTPWKLLLVAVDRFDAHELAEAWSHKPANVYLEAIIIHAHRAGGWGELIEQNMLRNMEGGSGGER